MNSPTNTSTAPEPTEAIVQWRAHAKAESAVISSEKP
jgi:hypothetical protein